MGTLAFVLRTARPMMAGVALVGALGASINAGLVAVLNQALHAQAGERASFALAFVGLALAKASVGYVSGRLLNASAQRTMTQLRQTLVRTLLRVPYRRLERIGAPRVHAALTHDLASINSALLSVPSAALNAAVLVGGAAYLLFLHWPTFLALLMAAVPGVVLYRLLARHARGLWEQMRGEHDRLYQHYRALTEGARELKMNAARRRDFVAQAVDETTEAMRRQEVEGTARMLLAQAANSLLVLLALGLLLFMVPAGPASGELATGFVLTGLYLLGPLTSLLRLLPMYARARIALSRIDGLGVALRGRGELEDEAGDAPAAFARIELDGVRYRYDGDPNGGGFSLGPLSLILVPGELVFLAGSNGSGKSTLAKLLAGLYSPDAGELRWEGRPVTRDTRDRYRQLWGAVFSEFHLFDRLYGLSDAAAQPRAQALLRELGLAEAVRLQDGLLSTLALSRGQQKRLALWCALLEDRPLYLFDEWAADQDPQFKETFYRRIVPELARRGKTVVVVTHDDRYFDVAQRVLTMRGGKLSEVRCVQPKLPSQAT